MASTGSTCEACVERCLEDNLLEKEDNQRCWESPDFESKLNLSKTEGRSVKERMAKKVQMEGIN